MYDRSQGVPGQDPQKVAEAIIQHLRSQNVGQGMEINIKQVEVGAWAWKADLTNRLSQMYFDALKRNNPSACYQPCGGAIPLLTMLEKAFKKIVVIVPGVEDPKQMRIAITNRSILTCSEGR